MIKTIRTIRAYVIAFQAHYGQVDKAGKPYINPVSYTHLTLPTILLV